MPTSPVRPSRWLAPTLLMAIGWAIAPAGGQSLDRRVEQLTGDPKLGQARVGVVIMDARSGQVLAEKNGDESFIPASNQKLLTSGAALSVLGKDFVFRTEIVYDPEFRAEASSQGGPAVTAGRVVVVGSGDPALADPKLLEAGKKPVESVLDAWIGSMKQAGVRPGAELVIDDRVFDRQLVHPSWPVEQLTRWYCAEVAGLNFHTNLLSIFASPQETGRPPAIRLEPGAGWIELRNKARSVKQGSPSVWAARDQQNNITLHGDVRFANDPVDVAVVNAPDFIARLIAERMNASGMRPSRVRLANADETLTSGRVIRTETTPISVVLDRCNTDSYNLYAEALLKRMGHDVTHSPGSFANGVAVVRMVLQEKLGIEAGQAIAVADGSGMSRNNRVTPRMLAQWLQAMIKDEENRGSFLESLPLVSDDEGTLRRRFRGKEPVSEVRAKTGYLSGVSAISGYITHPTSGRRLIFVLVTNDKPNRVQLAAVRDAEEKIILLADSWLNSSDTAQSAGSR